MDAQCPPSFRTSLQLDRYHLQTRHKYGDISLVPRLQPAPLDHLHDVHWGHSIQLLTPIFSGYSKALGWTRVPRGYKSNRHTRKKWVGLHFGVERAFDRQFSSSQQKPSFFRLLSLEHPPFPTASCLFHPPVAFSTKRQPPFRCAKRCSSSCPLPPRHSLPCSNTASFPTQCLLDSVSLPLFVFRPLGWLVCTLTDFDMT